MKFTHGFLAMTAVSSALAAPGSTLAERMHHRAMSRQSLPLQGAGDDSADGTEFRKAASDGQYSNNWAGVVREQAPPEGPYTAVTATFTIPTSTPIAGQNGVHAGSIWVGIDGDTYSGAILQAGVDFYSDVNQPNQAWYEWYPAYATNFPNIEVGEGHTIVATVRSTSPTEGIAIIQNRSTGQNVSQTVTAPGPSATLAGQNADWVVEDFQSGDSLVVMADFGEVKFTGAQTEAGGSTYGVKGGAIIDLKQNNQIMTSTEITADTEFTVKYIGK
ncbi:peptidase A4 family-domain-containing protein [Aspergillus coremiiformis]|uniref:Peptidase A4 family-domain-containing protein n=1 Tax=Aspergillus coremiiformis TaxID=138285 RepID=A0A5N6ZGD0_9EURO|nr:peptidase A4 family-domain-containing protein [Aspergillus coremiiformis]